MIVTASEWENFIALRAHHAAQEDIAILAELILQALNECEPQLLNGGEWHLPYGDRIDQTRLEETFAYLSELTAQNELIIPTSIEELRLMIIVARCARISYLNHENRDDYLADVALFSRLFREGHWSPFEHVARAIPKETYRLYYHATPEYIEYGWKANFRGWEQLRTLTPRNVENRPEPRLKPIQID
jgi:thymidylate synthase ThyX